MYAVVHCARRTRGGFGWPASTAVSGAYAGGRTRITRAGGSRSQVSVQICFVNLFTATTCQPREASKSPFAKGSLSVVIPSSVLVGTTYLFMVSSKIYH